MRRNRVSEARHPAIVRLRSLVKAAKQVKVYDTGSLMKLAREVERAEKFLRK
jgi:hypothetical protein